jgi:crossover junction endodeoxyribonuclease RusA
MLTITLPWPDTVLWPNRRPFWATRARAADAAHEAARDATITSAWDQGQGAETIDLKRAAIPITLIFHPPTRRAHDLDGALSACKGYLDGVAEAMGINDRVFEPTPRRGEVVRGGSVVIQIS